MAIGIDTNQHPRVNQWSALVSASHFQSFQTNEPTSGPISDPIRSIIRQVGQNWRSGNVFDSVIASAPIRPHRLDHRRSHVIKSSPSSPSTMMASKSPSRGSNDLSPKNHQTHWRTADLQTIQVVHLKPCCSTIQSWEIGSSRIGRYESD